MLESLNPPPDEPIIIRVNSLENWRKPFLEKLGEITGLELERQAASSTTKDIFTDGSHTRAYLVINDRRNQAHMQQLLSQVDFYTYYSHDPIFSAVVVPMTSALYLQYKDHVETVGMCQPYYGTDISTFRNSGFRLSKVQIETFIGNYRRLINHSHFSHGDLIVRKGAYPVVQWENVRIGPRGPLLIDYKGQGQYITMGLHRISPEDPNFNLIRDQEPDELERALKHFFSIND